MFAALTIPHRQFAPSALDASLVRNSGRRLSPYARKGRSLSVRVLDAELEHPLELPAVAVSLLRNILETMAVGQGIVLIP